MQSLARPSSPFCQIILLRSERESLYKKLEIAAKARHRPPPGLSASAAAQPAPSQDGEGRASELSEKDNALAELRAEAEALSKREAASQAQIRKLRASLRECEKERDELALRVLNLEREAELQLVTDVDVAKSAQTAGMRALQEANIREAALAASLNAQGELIERLQESIAATEACTAEREDALRAELSRLQRTCAELESSREELSASGTDAAAPLLRQLDELSRSAREAADAAAEKSARLLQRAQAAEAAASAAQTGERSARARAAAAEEAAKEKALHVASLSDELTLLMQRNDAEQRSAEAARQKAAELAAERDTVAGALEAVTRDRQLAREEESRLSRSHADALRAWRVREAELLAGISELQGAWLGRAWFSNSNPASHAP
jgi:hypothetical protein